MSMSSRLNISIHALRGEGDPALKELLFVLEQFQSTPSVGRATTSSGRISTTPLTFQSTPSVGRATFLPIWSRKTVDGISIHALRGEGDASLFLFLHPLLNFNPRPPWGGRRPAKPKHNKNNMISIHALRGEGDQERKVLPKLRCKFQSTPSVGRATGLDDRTVRKLIISIHALRGEGD